MAQPVPNQHPDMAATLADVSFILRNLEVVQGPDYTVPELHRAYSMITAHETTPARVKATIVALDRAPETWPPVHERVGGEQRRVDLAAMLGIVIGFEGQTAQRLIDCAREKKTADIVTFIVGEFAVLSVGATGVYGMALAASKGVTLAAKGVTAAGKAKAASLGFAKAGTVVISGFTMTMSAVGGAAMMIFWTTQEMNRVADNHDDILEPKFFKDQRILLGLLEGQMILPNPSPLTNIINDHRYGHPPPYA